jgi:hypothetical protein
VASIIPPARPRRVGLSRSFAASLSFSRFIDDILLMRRARILNLKKAFESTKKAIEIEDVRVW